MNRKLLIIVMALTVVLLATPFVGLAQAGKGQTKQYYEFFLQGEDVIPDPEAKAWLTNGNIEQARGVHYIANFIEVTVGEHKYYPDPASYVATMDLTLDLNTMHLTIRVHESFELNGGTITQDTAEMITNYGDLANMAGGGNLVGFGSGALDDVKIQGTSSFALSPTWGPGLDRVGTVMGWP